MHNTLTQPRAVLQQLAAQTKPRETSSFQSSLLGDTQWRLRLHWYVSVFDRKCNLMFFSLQHRQQSDYLWDNYVCIFVGHMNAPSVWALNQSACDSLPVRADKEHLCIQPIIFSWKMRKQTNDFKSLLMSCRERQPKIRGSGRAGASRSGLGKVSWIPLLSCSGNPLFHLTLGLSKGGGAFK